MRRSLSPSPDVVGLNVETECRVQGVLVDKSNTNNRPAFAFRYSEGTIV